MVWAASDERQAPWIVGGDHECLLDQSRTMFHGLIQLCSTLLVMYDRPLEETTQYHVS
jgi:hypothetical protein